MKEMKKILCLCMALTAAFTFTVGCTTQDNSSNSSSENSNSSSENSSNGSEDSSSSSIKDEEDDYSDTYLDDCELGEWELVREAGCETKGIKVRRCTNHAGATHEDYEFFAAREHSYNSQGVCEVCEKELVLPTPDAGAEYIEPEDPENGIAGSGTQYPEVGVANSGKYEFVAGEYYKVTIGNSGKCWFNFGVDGPGQYAVISTSNPNGVSLQQYTDNVNEENGETKYLDDGNFFVVIGCTELYYSYAWRSVYCLSGNPGDVVKFYITKVAPPTWEPGYEYVDKFATQIKGKAPDPEKGKAPVAVPYDSDYFYDEDAGYYRMGTKNVPGAIIYMAIGADMPRLLGDNSFIDLQEVGTSLRFHIDTTVEGNYVLASFEPMIYKNPKYNGTENSYEAYMNSNGLYPVTQELYEFLQLYTKRNTPIEEPEEGYEKNAWLSACFYYDEIVPGSIGYPKQIGDVGTYTAKQFSKYDKVYFQITSDFAMEHAGQTCTITVNTEKAWFWIDGVRHSAAEGAVTFDITTSSNFLISFMYEEMETVDMEFTITSNASGEGDKVDNDK